jgi:hypothetical protein
MTINKSQGGTFQRIGLELTSPVFSHGQLYVAFSRVHDYTASTVLTHDASYTTKNIVYPGIFEKGYLDTQIRAASHRPLISSRILTDEDPIKNIQVPNQNLTFDHDIDNQEDWSDHFFPSQIDLLNPPDDSLDTSDILLFDD